MKHVHTEPGEASFPHLVCSGILAHACGEALSLGLFLLQILDKSLHPPSILEEVVILRDQEFLLHP